MHPLDGIKVLDISTMLNGPYSALLLSDMGADVIKIEPPDGDPIRTSLGAAFMACNRGKRGLCIDLKKGEAKDIIYKLVKSCDIFIENARWGVWHRLGMDYESLKKIKSDLIYVSLLGHGSKGPLSKTAGYDPLLQARSGESVGQGGLGKPPVFHALALNDMATPILGAYGAILSLLVKAKTGKGQYVESSLTNAAVALQSGDFIDYKGIEREYRGDTGIKGLNPLNHLYEAEDQRWIILMCHQEEQWHDLCHVLDLEELLSDSRFIDDNKREANRDALIAILKDKIKTRSSEEWIEILSEKKIPTALGQTADEVINDPHCDANDLFTQVNDLEFGQVRLPGVVPKFSFSPGIIKRAAPLLGEHTEEILAELGYNQDHIEELKLKKVVIQADIPK